VLLHPGTVSNPHDADDRESYGSGMSETSNVSEDIPISVTQRAIEMGKQKLEEAGGGHLGIRVGVKGGGCSGLLYHFEFADDVREKRDLVAKVDGLTLLVDKRSLKYLAGSEAAMGAFIGDVAPEAQAEFLRSGIEKVHD